MSDIQTVERDERTVAVENAGHRWACIFLTYALLVDVMVRGLVRDEAAWDLLALAIAGGFITTIYQFRHKALPHLWKKEALIIVLCSAVIGAVIAAVLAAN